MSNGLLEASGIRKTYGQGHTAVKVLEGVDLTLAKGEYLSIVGPSGSGKSTLLHILGGLDTPDEGAVLYRGEDISKMWGGRRDVVRNKIFGFVFQFYHLLREFTALENVMMPELIRSGVFTWPGRRSEVRQRAMELLDDFGLAERAKHRPSELSGGEQQRVAIARALAGSPEILLCDEPTGNLDEATGKEIIDVLLGLNREAGQTMVIVTHDKGLAGMANRMMTLAKGRARPAARQ